MNDRSQVIDKTARGARGWPPYFSMLCSFSSSFRCRSITDRMMLRSSSVRWLRSGISDPAPAGGPDILLEADWIGVTTPATITIINKLFY